MSAPGSTISSSAKSGRKRSSEEKGRLKRLQRDFRLPFQLAKETLSSWTESKTPRLGAALAYYTIFGIAPLFLIVLRISSLWFGREAAQHQLFGQLQGLLGK